MSFRTGLWMYNRGVSAVCIIDGYDDYEFRGMNGWKRTKFVEGLGFSDSWDKVSVEEALSMARKRSGWNSALEKKFMEFPDGFVDEKAKKTEESVKLDESVDKKMFDGFSDRVKEALEIATKAHKGQKDRSGKPYIQHPMTVASFVAPDESAMVVALLHDVVEDTPMTFSDFRYFLNSNEMKALKLLTRNGNMDYMEYVKRIKGNPLATKVKLADLAHNSDIRRLKHPSEKDMERLEKYKRAVEILRG